VLGDHLLSEDLFHVVVHVPSRLVHKG
jgi:hypothetical protein